MLKCLDFTALRAPVAQLDRAFGYEPKGREFESLRARHFFPRFSFTFFGIPQLVETTPDTVPRSEVGESAATRDGS
jgi:hypothetical protein